MKFQILVPQHKETDAVIKPLLDSIEIQQNVDLKNDVGVIIVNDGSDVRLSEELLSRYSYPIEYHIGQHRGVSATRNACLDLAIADYVMFCDADDMFFNACGLYIIFREIDHGGFDSLVSAFVEEGRMPDTNEPIYVNHDMDSTFVHGKVHRRKYLLEKGIRWNDALTIHEDSFFNTLCQKLTSDLKYSKTPFYLWRWRADSVCRRGPKYILKTYNNMLDSNSALVREFLKRNMLSEAQFYSVSMIYDSYFTMNKTEWINQENQQYRKASEARFKRYYEDFRFLFETVPEDVKAQIIMGIKNRMYGEGLLMESVTFDDWMEHIQTIQEV